MDRAMFGLSFEGERCPDGMEIVASGDIRLLRARTDRREGFRLETQNLERPVVVEFINAAKDADFEKFFSKYGGTFHKLSENFSMLDYDVERTIQQANLQRLTIGGTILPEIVGELLSEKPFELTAELKPGDKGSAPRMLLGCETLADFMTMEIAMIAIAGAKPVKCEHCAANFLTGPLTGRRSHARFCSNRCRTAALRAREAE